MKTLCHYSTQRPKVEYGHHVRYQISPEGKKFTKSEDYGGV